MDLSNPRLKKILIGLAIFTVVVFIAVKIWRRSYYSYPNTSEDAQVPVTAMSGGAGGTVTVTAAGHNFKVGDIVLLKGTGLTISTTSGVMPTVSLPAGADTPVIVASAASGTFTFSGTFTGNFTPSGATAEAIGFGVMTTLKAALVTCQDTYATAIINAGTDSVAKATAATDRTQCIADAVAPYTRGHCQWLPPAPSSGNPNPTLPVPTSGPALTAYTEYQENIKKIQLAYVQAANRAADGRFTGLTDTAKASAIVSAARAADITGATQKYLATVCPGFYQPGDPAGSDPSPGYIAWSAAQGATAAATDPTANTTKHFWAPFAGITDTAILTWAQYAAPVTFVVNTGLSATNGYLNGITIAGYTDKSTYTTGTNGENWRIAYANGPGTVSSSVTYKTTA
jgi:hypothetical protein